MNMSKELKKNRLPKLQGRYARRNIKPAASLSLPVKPKRRSRRILASIKDRRA
jgi:hypothetical protein